MWIGQGVVMTVDRTVVSLSLLDLISFHGVQKNRPRSQGLVLKRNTKALANATAEIMWIEKTLNKLGISQPSAMV